VSRQGYSLVIGPEGADREWAHGVLFAGGLTVAVATEADVLAIPDLTPPNLVVMEDHTTREERMASLRRLQGHPSLQGVPILVLAYDNDIDSFTSAITRAAAYLVKPLEAEELLSVARRLSGWTGQSETTEKRRRLRRPLLMKVEVVVRSRKLSLAGQMVDASGGGCRVELGEELAPGELVRIILHTRDASTHVALGAEVRWHRLAPPGTHVVGMRFTGTTALLAAKLLGFLSSGLT
jgi:response regulator RpfG family c-di-GMP phosphodiesterase